MSVESVNGDGAPKASQNGTKKAEVPPEYTLPVKVRRKNSDKEWWVDCGAQDMKTAPLAAIVGVVRDVFQLGDSAVVRVRTSADDCHLDEQTPLCKVLGGLGEGDHLIVHVEDVEEKTFKTTRRGAGTDGAPGRVVRKKSRTEGVFTKSDGRVIGTVTTRSRVDTEDDLIHISGGYVLIQRGLLNLLKERVERPLMLESVCLFLGVSMGAIVSIGLALCDDTLPETTRARMWGALGASVIATVFLLVLGHFVRAERKKTIQPIIDELAAKASGGRKR